MSKLLRDLFIGRPVVFQLQLSNSQADVDLLGVDRFINSGAVVTGKLLDGAGNTVLDNVQLSYVAESNGVWRGEGTPQTLLIERARYRVVITATLGGASNTFSLWLVAKYDNGEG